MIARLGTTRIFDRRRHRCRKQCDRSGTGSQRGLPGVYPVLRQDAGNRGWPGSVANSLAQTCSVNFIGSILTAATAGDDFHGRRVGTGRSRMRKGKPLFRIWCDGTFGPYLWETLLEIAHDWVGGAVGIGAAA